MFSIQKLFSHDDKFFDLLEASADETREMARLLVDLLKDRSHMGIRNFLGDVFLDPRNPFEQARRQPKKWVAVIGGLFLLALLIVYSFHFL